MKRLVVSTLLSATLAAAAPLALAQSTAAGPQPRHQAEPQHEERASRMPGERVEARLAYLKTALKITEAQQTQWDAFANALRQQAQAMDARIRARRAQTAEGRRDAPNAIARLERQQQRLAAAAARVNEILQAAKPLYAALTAEQQKIADELLARQHRGMQGHRRGHA